ncbi:MAG TPA: hypothetical protein VFH51_10250 [Myxococcota bacterium]|nr:hypothetical protein [Myxococcota bacterium]
MRCLRWLSLCLVGLAACQSYPFEPFIPPPAETQQVTPPPPPPPVVVTTRQTYGGSAPRKTDMLLVIDSSGSMLDKQTRLANNAQQFIGTLVASGNAFRIGLITTDVVNPTQRGRLQLLGGTNARFLDAALATDPQAGAKNAALADAFITSVRRVGTSGDSRESGLAAALAALGVGPMADPNVAAYNAGFVRADADLAVVILSDEDDCSRTTASLLQTGVAGWTAEQCYEATLEGERLSPNDAIASLAAVKGGDVARVRAGVIIAGMTGSEGAFVPASCLAVNGKATTACGCWSYAGTNMPTYCEFNSQDGQPCGVSTLASCDAATRCVHPVSGACLPDCSAMGGYRYHQFVTALADARIGQGAPPGTAAGSICVDTFADALSSIAANVIAPSCFTLPEAPAPDAVVQVSMQKAGARPTSLPQLSLAAGTSNVCRSCGECPGGAFTVSGQTLCLACGQYLLPADKLEVTVSTTR